MNHFKLIHEFKPPSSSEPESITSKEFNGDYLPDILEHIANFLRGSGYSYVNELSYTTFKEDEETLLTEEE